MLQGESMDRRFFHRLGASLLDRTICASAGAEGLLATYGGKVGMHLEQYANSRLILIWGSNSIASNLHFWTFAQAAKRAGARLICIDPRRTETADKCHQHIALLPGTDGALALGLMQQLIVNGWLDQAYIDAHVQTGPDGWDALRDEGARLAARAGGRRVRHRRRRGARAGARLRDAGAGGDPAELRHAARPRRRQCSAADRAAAVPDRRVAASGRGHAAVGFGLVPAQQRRYCSGPDLLGSAPSAHAQHGDDRRRSAAPAAASRCPMAAASVRASRRSSSTTAIRSRWRPIRRRWCRGFERADLFTVVLEQFMTDTADLADYVLPATTQLEHLDIHASYGHTYVLRNEPAIAPLGQARPNTQIFRDLAARMGFDDPCFADDDETLAAAAFRLPAQAAERLRQRRLVPARPARRAVRRRRFPDRRRSLPDRVGRARPAGLPAEP